VLDVEDDQACDGSPCGSTQYTVYSIFKVQYRPLWTGGVPVYDISAVWTGGNQAPVGYLTHGGWASCSCPEAYSPPARTDLPTAARAVPGSASRR